MSETNYYVIYFEDDTCGYKGLFYSQGAQCEHCISKMENYAKTIKRNYKIETKPISNNYIKCASCGTELVTLRGKKLVQLKEINQKRGDRLFSLIRNGKISKNEFDRRIDGVINVERAINSEIWNESYFDKRSKTTQQLFI